MPGTYTLTEDEKKKFAEYLKQRGASITDDQTVLNDLNELTEWCIEDIQKKVKKYHIEFSYSEEYLHDLFLLTEARVVESTMEDLGLTIGDNLEQSLVEAISQFPELGISAIQSQIVLYEQICQKLGLEPSSLPAQRLEEMANNILLITQEINK